MFTLILWWSFAWLFACVARTSFCIFIDHRVNATGPTWVPSPGAVPIYKAYCYASLQNMAADWFDIDYSAFAYDRDFEEDLCIDDFTFDLMAQAPGLTRSARQDFQASEAWCAQALLHQTRTASNQYAEFFAHEPGAADVRVAGDVINPAGVPLQIPAYRLWSGAKRDDRHGKHAQPERQCQTRKRALQRAGRRAAAVGLSGHRGSWRTAGSQASRPCVMFGQEQTADA